MMMMELMGGINLSDLAARECCSELLVGTPVDPLMVWVVHQLVQLGADRGHNIHPLLGKGNTHFCLKISRLYLVGRLVEEEKQVFGRRRERGLSS